MWQATVSVPDLPGVPEENYMSVPVDSINEAKANALDITIEAIKQEHPDSLVAATRGTSYDVV